MLSTALVTVTHIRLKVSQFLENCHQGAPGWSSHLLFGVGWEEHVVQRDYASVLGHVFRLALESEQEGLVLAAALQLIEDASKSTTYAINRGGNRVGIYRNLHFRN